MTHWKHVFDFEIRRQFARKAYLFLTFGVPAIAILLFLAYRTYQANREDEPEQQRELVTDVGNQQIGYVDLTDQRLFPAPTSYGSPDDPTCIFDANDTFIPGTVKRVTQPNCFGEQIEYFESVVAGKAAVENGDLDILYVIEPDYLKKGEVSVYTKEFSISAADGAGLFVDYLLASLLQSADGQTYDLLYLRLREPSVLTEHRIAETGTETQNEGQNFVVAYVTGILLTMTLFWGGGYLMQSVVQEKESRIIEILLSSVPARALLVGKILAMGLVSIIQVTTLMGTALIIGRQAGSLADTLSDVEIGIGKIGLMVVYFIFGYLLFGGLMAAIGAMNTTSREAQNYTAAITLPAIVPFFFLSLFVEEPNSTLPTVLSLFPLTAPLAMIMRVAVADVPAWQILISLAGMGVLIVGVLWLAGKLFGVQSLLTLENALKLKDLPKVLRSRT